MTQHEAAPGLRLDEPMAEAGRRILRQQLAKMQQHESGSRSEDSESLRQMRVATRRMRSLFSLLAGSYKPKAIGGYRQELRRAAHVLGAVRDLDVLILDLQEFQAAQPTVAAGLEAAIRKLSKSRRKSRRALLDYLDSKAYARFVKRFGKFCTQAGAAGLTVPPAAPHQVRHCLPMLLHERLARVRAYETVLDDAPPATLHALRVECKQLRYALEFFQPLLGAPAARFILQVEALQDSLGRMNDIALSIERVQALKGLKRKQAAAIAAYVRQRRAEWTACHAQFEAQWAVFSERRSFRQFSDSLLLLR